MGDKKAAEELATLKKQGSDKVVTKDKEGIARRVLRFVEIEVYHCCVHLCVFFFLIFFFVIFLCVKTPKLNQNQTKIKNLRICAHNKQTNTKDKYVGPKFDRFSFCDISKYRCNYIKCGSTNIV